jgi:AbrB family looped-hinge helix DNA binding protein
MEEPEVATVGTKGQIVIPKKMRKELKITTNTKVAVYRKGDKLVVAKLEVPPLGDELGELFDEIDRRYKGKRKPTEKDILAEIQAYRKVRRAAQGA